VNSRRPLSHLPPLKDDEYRRQLAETFILVIESLDTATLLVQKHSSDWNCAELLELLDGERLWRAAARPWQPATIQATCQS